jgi:hypothetical protein
MSLAPSLAATHAAMGARRAAVLGASSAAIL